MNHPTAANLAASYGITREHFHATKKAFGLTSEDFHDPAKVFDRLLESGRKSPLRSRLTDPITRAKIAAEIELSAIRGNVPSAEEKISSIK